MAPRQSWLLESSGRIQTTVDIWANQGSAKITPSVWHPLGQIRLVLKIFPDNYTWETGPLAPFEDVNCNE